MTTCVAHECAERPVVMVGDQPLCQKHAMTGTGTQQPVGLTFHMQPAPDLLTAVLAARWSNR